MMLADCVRPRIEDPLPALRTPEAYHESECTTGTYARPKRPNELPRVARPAGCGPLPVRPLEAVQASVQRDRAVFPEDHHPRQFGAVRGERVAVPLARTYVRICSPRASAVSLALGW